jgi:WD40 repeat protein
VTRKHLFVALVTAAWLGVSVVAHCDDQPAAKAERKFDRYGDPLPEGALLRLGTIRLRQPMGVECVAVSADGKFVASGGVTSVRIWDAATGALVREFRPGARALAFSPDGRAIAFGNDLGVLHIWDVEKARERIACRRKIGDLDRALAVHAVAIAPDGTWVAAAGQGVVSLYEPASGEEILTLRHDDERPDDEPCLAVSPDSKVLASSNDSSIRLWDLARGGAAVVIEKAHDREVTAMTFTPDGKTLISGGHRSEIVKATADEPLHGKAISQVRAWDARTGEPVGERLAEIENDRIRGLWLSPDGATLVTSLSRKLQIVAWPTGRELAVLPTGERLRGYGSGSMSVSRDGKTLALATECCALEVWDAIARKRRLECAEPHSGKIHGVIFSPDGRSAATAGDDGVITLWDAATGRETQRLVYSDRNLNLRSLRFSPDGDLLAAGGNHFTGLVRTASTVRVWRVATGELVRELPVPSCPFTICFSPDGKRLATGDAEFGFGDSQGEAPIRVFDLADGRELAKLEGHELSILALAFTADGRQLVSASEDRTLRVWDLAAKRTVRTIKLGLTDAAAISADGSVAVVNPFHDEDAKRKEPDGPPGMTVWDISAGKEIQRLETYSWGGAYGDQVIAMSGNRRLVAGNANRKVQFAASAPGTICIWDTASGKEVLRLRYAAAGAWAFAFSPDGRKLASGMTDGTALIWDVSPAYDKFKPMEKKP